MNAYATNAVNSKLIAPGAAMSLFLAVQAIRQLVQVNQDAADGKEGRAGQVATWFNVTLLLVAAYLMTNQVKTYRRVVMVLGTLILGVLASGTGMIYSASAPGGKNPEKNRLWFGIAHIVFALILIAYTVYSFA